MLTATYNTSKTAKRRWYYPAKAVLLNNTLTMSMCCWVISLFIF